MVGGMVTVGLSGAALDAFADAMSGRREIVAASSQKLAYEILAELDL